MVNAWYIAAYEPIRDSDKKVIGMLYVGVPEESATALRKAIMSVKVGKTGYVYVLNATGSTRGHYVISQNGKRDGEDLWAAKDADGKLFIQEICNKGRSLEAGQTTEVCYSWQNPGEPAPRKKIVLVAYFAPWDWVIGVGAYEDEFLEAIKAMNTRANETIARVQAAQSSAIRSVKVWCLAVGCSALLIAVAVALFVVRGITRPLNRVIGDLNEGAEQVNGAAGQVAAASQNLAGGASEQAASLQETAATLQQMTAQTHESAEQARQASDLSVTARTAADEGGQTMNHLNSAMTGITDSSKKISKIIKVIEEIAFQTNLLALNAAVEAARAGEHGKGFAVVVDEVRNLAQRAASAARETTALIEDAVGRARTGEQIAVEAGKALNTIISDVSKVSTLLHGIANGTTEQAHSFKQISTAVGQMDTVTQQNASSAEETAAAAEQLSAQAASVRGSVEQLMAIVDPSRNANR